MFWIISTIYFSSLSSTVFCPSPPLTDPHPRSCDHKVLMPLKPSEYISSRAAFPQMNEKLKWFGKPQPTGGFLLHALLQSRKENDGRFSVASLEATSVTMFPKSRVTMSFPRLWKNWIMNYLHMRGRQEQLVGEGVGGSYIKSWREQFKKNDGDEK